jgi:hypothetical protein
MDKGYSLGLYGRPCAWEARLISQINVAFMDIPLTMSCLTLISFRFTIASVYGFTSHEGANI